LGFNEALKYGFLDTLAVVFAGLCDLSETTSSLGSRGRNIISNEVEHRNRPLHAKKTLGIGDRLYRKTQGM
jgi:hypothetical protein